MRNSKTMVEAFPFTIEYMSYFKVNRTGYRKVTGTASPPRRAGSPWNPVKALTAAWANP